MNRKLQVAKYVLADFISAAIAWSLFFVYRKYTIHPEILDHLDLIFFDRNFYIGIIIIPCFWLTFYVLVGTYKNIFRKSRLRELGQTIVVTFIGVIFIFFALIIDDAVISYKTYYQSFMVLYLLHFFITFLFRLIITTNTVRRIHKKIIGFKTLVVGSNKNAIRIFNEIEGQKNSSGNLFVGFVNVLEYDKYQMSKFLPHLGYFKDLKKIVKKNEIEEVIIAIERSEQNTVENIITEIEDTDFSILSHFFRDY